LATTADPVFVHGAGGLRTKEAFFVMQEKKVWDVAVIGGGTAGLAAAALAARSGASVLLLERGGKPGGRSVSLREGGAVLNMGPHALYRGGAAQSVLQALGIETPGGSPTANIHWVPGEGRGEIVATAGILMGRTLSWAEKRRFLRFFLGVRKTDARKAEGHSWAAWMKENGLTGRAAALGAAMGRLSTYVGNADCLDAGAAVRQLQKPSVIYPNGGWQTIVDGLVLRAKQAGVTCLTSASVTGAEPDNGGHGGWTLGLAGGETVKARKIIAAIEPSRVASWFEPWLPAAYFTTLKNLEPVYASTLDLHLRRLPRPNRPFALGLDQPLYFSAQSQWSRLCDNPEHAVVHVMRYDGAQKGESASVRTELEVFLDRLQPGWREEVLRERYMPHIAVMHGLPSPAMKGTAGRPAVDTGLPGVYVAGDWAGPEGMLLDASLASAKEAARLAVQHEPIGVVVS
jgi:phytoene dehydrogenase-like protein